MHNLRYIWTTLLQRNLTLYLILLFFIFILVILWLFLDLPFTIGIGISALIGFAFGYAVIRLQLERLTEKNPNQSTTYLRKFREILEEFNSFSVEKDGGDQICKSICEMFGYQNLCLMIVSQQEQYELQKYSLKEDPNQDKLRSIISKVQDYYYGENKDKLKEDRNRIIKTLFTRPTSKIVLSEDLKDAISDYYKDFILSNAIVILPKELSGARFAYAALINRSSNITRKEEDEIKQQLETETHPLTEIIWFLIEYVIDAKKMQDIEEQLYVNKNVGNLRDDIRIVLKNILDLFSYSAAFVYIKNTPKNVGWPFDCLEIQHLEPNVKNYFQSQNFLSLLNSLEDLEYTSTNIRMVLSKKLGEQIKRSNPTFPDDQYLLLPIHVNERYIEILFLRSYGPEFAYGEYLNLLRLLRLVIILYELKSEPNRSFRHSINQVIRSQMDVMMGTNDNELKNAIHRFKEFWENYKRAYIDQDETNKIHLNVADLIDDALKSLGLSGKTDVGQNSWEVNGITITANYRDPNIRDTVKIDGYKTSLHQVFQNLLQNAREAIEGCPNKRINIKVETMEKGLEIEISNTGPRIQEDLEKIWELGFTTKRYSSDNQGIGLYEVKDCIENKHNGTIKVENREEETSFIITLPT